MSEWVGESECVSKTNDTNVAPHSSGSPSSLRYFNSNQGFNSSFSAVKVEAHALTEDLDRHQLITTNGSFTHTRYYY